MPPAYFPLRWEITGDQWWFASPIDWAAANGHYDLVRELLHLDTNLLIKLTSLRRIRRLETVWDDEEQFDDVAKCRSQVAQKLLLQCESKKGHNSLIRAGYGGWLLYTAASAGDVGFVKHLLERNPLLVYGEGEYGVTDILHAAARSKNSDVFRLLLDASLRNSANGGNKVEVQPEEVSSVYKWEIINRAVHAAARGGNVEMLKELLGNCTDVLVYRDAQGSTLLHTASSRGQVEVVRSLLASYDLVNSTDNQGNTALNIAAYRGHLGVVEVLISASPSTMSMKNNYGDTFVHMAVASFRSPGFRRLDRQMELMKQLASSKTANIEDIINVKNNDGRTALHMAVMENIHTDLVELLMSVPSINLNIRDNQGRTPLDLLKQRPKSASSEILIKRVISAGGISNCRDHMTRTAIVSHLKTQGIGGSPGASFRIPDSEIFLYTGIEIASDIGTDVESPDYDLRSGELSNRGSPSGSRSNKTSFSSVNSAARRLQILLHFPKKKDRKMEDLDVEEADSVQSYRTPSPMVGQTQKPISLRQRFSKMASSNKIVALPSGIPSPSTKKKFAAGLMHGVLQVKRSQSSFASPSSPFSESSWSSPMSTDGERETSKGNQKGFHSSSFSHSPKTKMNRSQNSFNMKTMNQYLCFGAQGVTVEDAISSAQSQNSKNQVE